MRQRGKIAFLMFSIGVSAYGATPKKKSTSSSKSTSSAKSTSSSRSTLNPKMSSFNPKAPALDVSGLQKQSSKKSTKQDPPPGKKFKKNTVATKGVFNNEASELAETIKGINLLLSKNPSDDERIKLLLNRARGSYSLARRRLLDSKKMGIDEPGRRLLAIAAKDIESVMAINGISKKYQSQAMYMKGLMRIYADDSGGARLSFISALDLDPGSEDAGWMALYIAEDLFEAQKYREALPYYKGYQNSMDKREWEISRYKQAWCYVNLETHSRAKELFVELVKENPESGFGKDSIKDLAYMVTTYDNEGEALRLSSEMFTEKQNPLSVEFLSTVLQYLENQNALTANSKVLARLLEIEPDPLKRFQFLLAGLRASRKLYASVNHFNSLMKIREFMIQESLDNGKPAFDQNKEALDIETQNVLRAYVETFAGRTKTPEPLEKAQVGEYLKVVFEFYAKYFSKAKPFPTIARLWIETCGEMTDWKCVDAVAEIILDRKDMTALHPQTVLDQIVALEKLSLENAAEYKAKLLGRLEQFSKREQSNPRWLEISNRLAQLYMEAKVYNKAIPLYDVVYTKTKSEESIYRLQWSRFEVGLFKDVFDEKRRSSEEKEDPRLTSLKRESALNLAVAARTGDNFEDYKKFVNAFLQLGPTPEKAMVARKDYFSFMIEKKLFSEAVVEFLRLPVEIRHGAPLASALESIWLNTMKLGKFSEAAKLVRLEPKEKPKGNLASKLLMADFAQGKSVGLDAIKTLSADSRDYFLSVATLVDPGTALSYFASIAPVKGKEQRNLAALAIRIKTGDWGVYPSSYNSRILGPNYSYGKKDDVSLLPVEKFGEKIVVPSSHLKGARLVAATTEFIKSVRLVRNRIPRAIKGKPVNVQLRAAQLGRTLESAASDFITKQPIPEGLTGEQITEYETGIQNAAQEFAAQAAEFEKLETSFEERLAGDAGAKVKRELAMPDMRRWSWPAAFNSEDSAALRAAMDNHNYRAAMILLDLLREELLTEPGDYYAVRSGILLSTSDNTSMRRYVVDELEGSNQEAILVSWKQIIGLVEEKILK